MQIRRIHRNEGILCLLVPNVSVFRLSFLHALVDDAFLFPLEDAYISVVIFTRQDTEWRL